MKTVVVLVFIICTAAASKHGTMDEEERPSMKDILQVFTKGNLQDIFGKPEGLLTTLQKDNRADTRPNIVCVACDSAIGALVEMISNGFTDEELIDTGTTLCIAIGIASESVCSGAVRLNAPILRYIFENTPEAPARTFCGILLQFTGNPNFCPYDSDLRFNWEVELPDYPTVSPPVIDTNPQPLKIAVLTDAHIDPLYEPFGVGDCDEPTCCRKGQRPRETPDGRPAEPAGYWGDYRNCDSPVWAYDDVIERISETHEDIEAVYYIGDTIDHFVWETTYELINNVNRHLIEKMRSSFAPHVLVVPNIGNHESQPTNQFAPEYITQEKLNTTWLYRALEDKWRGYIPDEYKEDFLTRGEFSVLLRPGLRVISLNNNVAYKFNWWITFDPLDAKKHLDWLVEELHKAELNGEKVHILAHLPPGTHDLTEPWTIQYNKIYNRFSSTIVAEFNGHVHSNDFKIYYSPDGSPINVAWGSGCATAYTHYNLNYKVFEFNPRTFEPERISNFIYNVTEANLTPHRRPHWFQLYEMKSSFELNDLSPTSMNELVYKMTSETRFLDLYAAFTSRLSDNRWPTCNEGCKLNHMCRIVTSVLWQDQKCTKLVALYHENQRV